MTASPSTVPVTTTTSRLPALRPGVHLFPSSDGRDWFLAEPGERFTRLLGPAEALDALQSELHGGPVAEGVPQELRDGLATALAQRGVLTGPTTRPGPPAAPRIRLAGSGPVAEFVRRSFASWAEVTPDPVGGDAALDPAPPEPSGPCDVRVTCAGWLPDEEFRAHDDLSRTTGIPWHHCHVEGTSLAVGPFRVPGGVGHRDWRGRRLAASTTPAELEAYWTHLDDLDARAEVGWPDPGVCAVAAALLVDDVRHWWDTRQAPTVTREHVVGRDASGALRWSRHPVLPLPLS